MVQFDKTYVVFVPMTATVGMLFTEVAAKTSLNANEIRLAYGGKELTNFKNSTLMSLNIQNGGTVSILYRVKGGQ
jgi:hypothetical protein